MTPITALGSRYGIQGALGRSVKRASTASTWWDLNGTITSCVAAYQPKGAASYAASLANLTGNATYDATEVVGTVSWDSTNGWKGDKTNYLDTGVSVNNLYPSIIVRCTNIDTTATNEYLCGAFGTATYRRFQIGVPSTGNQLYYGYGDKAAYYASTTTNGVFAMTKDYGYYNGSPVVSLGSGAYLTIPNTVCMLGRNYGGDDNPTTAYIQAIAVYNTTLTAQNISDLTTAMAAL